MNENVKKRLHLNNYRSFFCEKVRIRQLEKVKENVQRMTILTLKSLRMLATIMETPLKDAPMTPATGWKEIFES